VPVVVDAMGDAFPELKTNPGRVVEIVKDEEVSFGRTLGKGLVLLESAAANSIAEAYTSRFHPGKATSPVMWSEGEPGSANERVLRGLTAVLLIDSGSDEAIEVPATQALEELRQSGHPTVCISGEDAFKLHDTYGFPIDLTRIMAEERGMSVDLAGYEKLMGVAREKARAGGKEHDTSLTTLTPDAIALLQQQAVPQTNDSSKFTGPTHRAHIRAIWDGKQFAAEARHGKFTLILDQTNFYSEMGGQVGDVGSIEGDAATSFNVETTRLTAGYVLHAGHMAIGTLKVGQLVTLTRGSERLETEQNHTTTHLANWALREVLGDAVQQKGSLVDPDKLRFDFSHNKALTDDEVGRAEQLVNEYIGRRAKVYAEEAPQEQALKINGLRAVFGEKYPPMVRVVSVGVPVADLLSDPANPEWRRVSVEFCGGTHVRSTDEAGGFVIAAEESVSKGIRRIVAHTGDAARRSTPPMPRWNKCSPRW
jgi:alanyl-tRNA synthetase